MHLRDAEISKQEIVIDDKGTFNFLGPNLLLLGSRVVSKVSGRAIGFGEVVFQSCVFETKQKLHGISWCDAKLVGTSFVGLFSGNDFGHWGLESSFGSIEDCDFSASILDGCRFFGCDPSSLVFPDWPTFVVEFPHESARRMRKVEGWERFEVLLDTYEMLPSEVVAVTGYAPTMTRLLELDEDEVHSFLERCHICGG